MSQQDALVQQRKHKARQLIESGRQPYAPAFKIDSQIADFVRTYEPWQEAQMPSAPSQSLAGRVMAMNRFGKAAFLRIQDGSSEARYAQGDAPHPGHPIGKLQVYLRSDHLPEEDFDLLKNLDVGDIVGVHGKPMRTKTGELTVLAAHFEILTKALRPLPEKWHGLADVEKRYRQRYVDLMVNPRVRQIFHLRSHIIGWLRSYFIQRGFLEVETPMMQPLAGGAAAKPFVTHHNALGVDLYLRIAPELYLKRLVVGGLDRVFEINRSFRNEGLSTVHNPEFTMLEFYQAYASFSELMDMAEELLAGVVQGVLGTTSVSWQTHRIGLDRPFQRMTMLQAIAAHGGPSEREARCSRTADAALQAVGISPEGLSEGQKVVALFEHFAEKKLIQPTFVYDFPADVSPLARKQLHDPWFVDRFELYVAGRELANAFNELNDPTEQRQRFEDQFKDPRAHPTADPQETHALDEDYLRALEYGMPPTGGFGMGLDRLVMLLTNASSIREVILFPQLRPER